MKKRTVMLNVSLILCAFYEVCFFAGYFLLKPLFAPLFYAGYDEFEPTFSPVVIVLMLFLAAGVVIFNMLLRKKRSTALTIGTAVFSAAAFECNVLIKRVSAFIINYTSAQLGGADELAMAYVSNQVVSMLDMIFMIFFVASLALMLCAACVKE